VYLEYLSVLRRLTVTLVLWLGLLGVGTPAFACSVAALDTDCCPQDTPAPCTDNDFNGGLSASAAFCCVAAPTPARTVSVDAGRNAPDRKHDAGSPDPLGLPAWITSLPTVAAPPNITAVLVSPGRTDAALTYLRTGRLRL